MHAELTLRTVLQSLPKDRLVQVGQHFNVGVPEHATRDAQVALLERSRQLRLQKLLEWLGRDELRRLCERLGLPSRERSRAALAVRLLEHAGAADSAPAAALPSPAAATSSPASPISPSSMPSPRSAGSSRIAVSPGSAILRDAMASPESAMSRG